jgi:adenylate cyclase
MAVVETIVLGGIATCALSYLQCERILRRSAARVLHDQAPGSRILPRVVVRSLLFWALGTAGPVLGVLLAAVSSLVYSDVHAAQLAVIVLAVGGTALVVGLLVTVGAARAVADPADAVRRAMARVEQGDLAAEVPVYDGTELGQLQAGFNTMVAGLRERERLRDLFGRHVGQEVAQSAVDAGEPLLRRRRGCRRGERRVDRRVRGRRGTGRLGAPVSTVDPAGSALAAGRCLGERPARELPEIRAGIGVSAGDAVAGNVADMRRFEYTVIGDPVNEAARLTELATEVPERVLAAGRAVDLAAEAEAARWTEHGSTVLRGRPEPTRLAVPNGR